jgi:hypothetical protein
LQNASAIDWPLSVVASLEAPGQLARAFAELVGNSVRASIGFAASDRSLTLIESA